jgi:hypothetical protein
MTVQRQVADISKDLEIQLCEIFEFIYYSLTVDELTDISSIEQMCIFACGITSHFEVFEEFVDLHSMQGYKGMNLIQAVLCSLQKHNLELSKLMGLFTDGVFSVIGCKMEWRLFANICMTYISRIN